MAEKENILFKGQRDTLFRNWAEIYASLGLLFVCPGSSHQHFTARTFCSSSFESDVGLGVGPRTSGGQLGEKRWEPEPWLEGMPLIPLRLPVQTCCTKLAFSVWPETLYTEWMCKSWDKKTQPNNKTKPALGPLSTNMDKMKEKEISFQEGWESLF